MSLFSDTRLASRSFGASSLQSAAFLSDPLGQKNSPAIQRFGTRSRLEIGQFDRVFTTSGSVRRNFADVFRFSLTNRRSIRIYVGNEFSNPNSNNRRMVVDLIDDRTLRPVTSVTVVPRGINAITRRLNPGTYRISISTRSNDRGRYFMDMVRI